MSDITPIRLAAYEHLAVRTIDTVVSTVEPGALVESPDDWHVLAFSASGRDAFVTDPTPGPRRRHAHAAHQGSQNSPKDFGQAGGGN